MNAIPIVDFERRHGNPEKYLIDIAGTNLSSLSASEENEVFLEVQRAAEEGSGFAMCLCATWPDTHGRGNPSDATRYRWASLAATRNYPPGLFELGVCLEKGIGTETNIAKALVLYERSSAQGFGLATHRLGMGYISGDFGVIDIGKARCFLELAFEQGESLGALCLGQLFESGDGVAQDFATSILWYQRASEMGNFFATYRLQCAYDTGELGLPRDALIAKQYEIRVFQQTDDHRSLSPNVEPRGSAEGKK